jgi:hypothetical protein
MLNNNKKLVVESFVRNLLKKNEKIDYQFIHVDIVQCGQNNSGSEKVNVIITLIFYL